MAGRKTKPDFDFFQVDTDFFVNQKIKTLRRRFGSVGILTYLYILYSAYSNKGYYTEITSIEDFSHEIAESIGNSNLANIASKANDCISYLASSGEIDKHLLESKRLISGKSIQCRYIEMCLSCKRKVVINQAYLLVDLHDYPIDKIHISTEEITNSTEEITNSTEEMKRSISRNRSINHDMTTGACAHEESDFENRFKSFCEKWDIAVDSYSSLITELDFEKLDKAYFESASFLQDKEGRPFAQTLSWIVKNAQSIYAGKYKDKKRTAPRKGVLDEWEALHAKYAQEENEDDDGT